MEETKTKILNLKGVTNDPAPKKAKLEVVYNLDYLGAGGALEPGSPGCLYTPCHTPPDIVQDLL